MTTTYSNMLTILDSTDFTHIMNTRNQLVQMGTKIVPQLIESLRCASVKQAINLVTILGEIKDERAVSPLCDLLLNHNNLMIRSKSAEALGCFNNTQTIDALIQSLNNPQESEVVMMWVVTSLGTISDSRTYHALVTYLEQIDSSTMQYMTIRALGNLGNKNAIPYIAPYLHSSDHHVRRDAEITLSQLGYDVSSKEE